MKILFKTKLKNLSGVTLVEVIVGVALIGIISVMVLTVFTTGMTLAANAGDNSEVVGNAIAKTNKSIIAQDSASTGTKEATVYFTGNPMLKVDVEGNLVTESDSSIKNETTIHTFVPVKVTMP